MDSWGQLAQKIRVPAGTILGVVFLLLMRPTQRSLWLGGVLAVAGACLRLWAAGHIEKGRTLTCDGPYSLTRNPLYLGSLIMAVGIIVAGQVYWLLLPFGAFYLSVYYPVMRAEERELREGYGADFLEYSRRVPLFLPRIRLASYRSSRFRWTRVLQNREHRTMFGLLLTEGFLVLRSLY